MNEPSCPPLGAGAALLIVDLQNDFLSRGSLAVPDAEAIIPALNAVLAEFERRGLPIIVGRDWHPANHCSFYAHGGPWPPHCVAGTPGAEFPAALALPAVVTVVSKASAPDEEAYSAFGGSDLATWLRGAGVTRLYIGGVTLEYCVRETVADARRAGFEVVVLEDAIRAIDPASSDAARARTAIRDTGAMFTTAAALRAQPNVTPDATAAPPPAPDYGLLLTDLYQLAMLQSYHDQGMSEVAVFEFFVRRLPDSRNFLLAAGLAQVVEFLLEARFSADELVWMKASGRLRPDFVDTLATWRFTGDIDAMPEGSVFFADEPILRVVAPLGEAQLVETRVINILQTATMIASKAARCVLAADGRPLLDFGLRRAHGGEAGLLSARASYLAGFAGTSNVRAGQRWGIPVFGTMAHSYVQAHVSEDDAFEQFARSHPHANTMLIDTYDTEAAAARLGSIAARLARDGIRIQGVRIDSGDLGEHARRVRQLLDQQGLQDVQIFASGNLEEFSLRELVGSAPIDAFGVGTRMNTSADAPFLDCAYKLQEYAGRPRRKRSEGKVTWPGRKQVYRRVDGAGREWRDVLTTVDAPVAGTALLAPVMRAGRLLAPLPTLAASRQHAAAELARLPDRFRQLEPTTPYYPDIGPALRELAARLDEEHDRGAASAIAI
jgi:nicotinate phosphoribosyltransferase